MLQPQRVGEERRVCRRKTCMRGTPSCHNASSPTSTLPSPYLCRATRSASRCSSQPAVYTFGDPELEPEFRTETAGEEEH